jgi:MFS family permease
MGLYSGFSRTGSVAGNLVGALGYDQMGYRAVMLAFGVVSLAAVPLGVLSQRGRSRAPVESVTAGAGAAPAFLIGCGFIVGCVGPGLIMSTLGLILRGIVGERIEVSGVTLGVATLTGMLLSARWLSELAGAPLLGHLSDVLGRRGSATAYFAAGGGALAAGALTTGLLPLIGVVAAFFLCAVGVTTALMAEAGSRGPRAVAFYVTAADVGSAVGPLVGWSTQQAGLTTETIFWVAAALYGAGVAGSRRAFRKA